MAKPSSSSAPPPPAVKKPHSLAGLSSVVSGWSSFVYVVLLAHAAFYAYDIRLFAVRNYGRIIHEFDPWFNFRATQYLEANGAERFFKWFDYMVWYPLGRPVGTTIYPGMQFTAVYIYRAAQALLGPEKAMSLNDVCVFMPAWFGVVATLLVGMLAYECSGSAQAGVAASLVMSVIPSHIMRAIAGGFDNESVAITAMVLTFYLWTRSVRNKGSWPFGFLAGLAYFYMVATWGGFVFVLNLVAFHAFVLVVTGKYTHGLHKSYTLFYIIGTVLAIQVPIVNLTPLKSMEQLSALLVFAGMQVWAFMEYRIEAKKAKTFAEKWQVRIPIITAAAMAGVAVIIALIPPGYFGPLSTRVRGLFIKHTRTGNPLVDSVAEHQPANSDAYWHYLHYACYYAPFGFLFSFVRGTPGALFVVIYSAVSYYFSSKMNRLIILMGPIASVASGIAIGYASEWCLDQVDMFFADFLNIQLPPLTRRAAAALKEKEEAAKSAAAASTTPAAATTNTPGKGKRSKDSASTSSKESGDAMSTLEETIGKPLRGVYNSPIAKIIRIVAAVAFVVQTYTYTREFFSFSYSFAEQTSQPQIVFKGQLRDGRTITVNDYVESYEWLRDNTPEDARVMAWWDYGYQITGIANRTSVADGNTWNLEHIALIGRALTSSEKKAHKIVRHLADYVLVWAGGGGDDLAKSPHIARIGTSVYHDICPNDPLCRGFGFYDQQRTPTPSMAASLLYKMVMHNHAPGVTVDDTLFKEVYSSKYGKVRIFKVLKVSKKSKKWVADPANRKCDRPGSWYCPGQYPPDLPGPPETFRQLNYEEANKD